MQPWGRRPRRLPVLLNALLACVSAAGAIGAPVSYEHQTWRSENGLPQNSVNSILQTADGYIWLATDGGLARFDGLKFTVFDSENTPQLRDNHIRALLETKDKSLWIATADGLIQLRNGKFTAFTTAEGLPGNNVLSLIQNAQGDLSVTTTEGVAIYRNGRYVPQPGNNSLGKTIILTDRLGRLWTGSNDGLTIYKSGMTRKLDLRQWLSSTKVTALFQDTAGTIWVGTETGAVRIVSENVYAVSSPDSISQSAVLSFFEDREGDIWVGTDSSGVTVFRNQRFRKFRRDDGMPDDLVRCIFEDSHGIVWAGTNGHGLRRFDGRTFSSFTTADGLSSDVILSLAADARGHLLVGTPDGLNIVQQDHVQWLTSADGLPDDLVRSIYKDMDDSLWLGTRRGLAHYAAGATTTYTTADGLASNLTGAISRGKNGCLWVGTLKGLVCLTRGRITRPASLARLQDQPITALFEDSGAVLWIGTDTEGLVRLAGDHEFLYPSTLGLPKTVSGIVEDSHDQLWITSTHGLFRLSKRELNAYAAAGSGTVSVTSYGTGDGLPVNEFSTGGHPTVWKDHQNTIWLASAKGVVSIDASHTAPNRIPPSVAIEQITAGDRLLDPPRQAALGPDLSRLSFTYTGLSFAAPQQVRFKYRMEGFDRTWIEAGTNRSASYTNLPPGNYRFVVLARNNDGIWNKEGAALSFQMLPHYYQTNWFRAIVLLAIAALCYAIYRLRVNYVRTQLNAVMAERNRIAREIHDTLAQAFVGVSLKLELVRRLLPASSESAGEVLVQAQGLVQHSLAEARRSIWDLRSEAGPAESLGSKLSQAVRQAAPDKRLDIAIEVTGASQPLPPRMETEVLRIGREAVMNVVRHANASRVDITLAFDSTRARMTIRDDGQGFVLDEFANVAGAHFGLRGMRERAEAIKAKLSVTSALGQGTQICLELPLK